MFCIAMNFQCEPMKNTRLSIVSIFAAALAAGPMISTPAASEPPAAADLQNLAPDRRPVTVQYFFNQPISAYDGHENRDFGDFLMCVDIFTVHGHQYVFIWNVMTAVDRWLVIKPVSLEDRSSGKFEFNFMDNWENEGAGSLEYLSGDRIRIGMKPTKPSEDPPSRNILGQYGTHVLSKAACPRERFLEGAVPE